MVICNNCGKSIAITSIEEDEEPDYSDADLSPSVPVMYEKIYRFTWEAIDRSDCKKGCGHSPSFGVALPRMG